MRNEINPQKDRVKKGKRERKGDQRQKTLFEKSTGGKWTFKKSLSETGKEDENRFLKREKQNRTRKGPEEGTDAGRSRGDGGSAVWIERFAKKASKNLPRPKKEGRRVSYKRIQESHKRAKGASARIRSKKKGTGWG